MLQELKRVKEQLEVANQRIRDLEISLGQVDRGAAAAFKLSASLSKLLGCLMETPNVTPEMIVERLEIATDAKVAVHRLRMAMKPWQVDKKPIIKGRRGLGYWIDQPDKERLNTIVASLSTPTSAAP
jgi:hypothetical protein